jgi:hypothetical protein
VYEGVDVNIEDKNGLAALMWVHPFFVHPFSKAHFPDYQ